MSEEMRKLIQGIRAGDLNSTLAQLTLPAVNLNQLCDGALPIVEAARAGVAYIDALISSGADVNGRDAEDRTALLYACETGDIQVVRALLAAHANPNASSGAVENPLRSAVKTRSPQHLEILRALVANGADVNLPSKSKFGNPTSTPLIEASRVGNLEAVKGLVAAGAEVNASVMRRQYYSR